MALAPFLLVGILVVASNKELIERSTELCLEPVDRRTYGCHYVWRGGGVVYALKAESNS